MVKAKEVKQKNKLMKISLDVHHKLSVYKANNKFATFDEALDNLLKAR